MRNRLQGPSVCFGSLLVAASALGFAQPERASACGGFFCGRQPVDQTAERIVFRVNESTTTMITQIAYQGTADEFAWVLPLGSVPDVESLDIFPQRALTGLDANTGPQFNPPPDCQGFLFPQSAFAGAATDADDSSDGNVTVHYRAEVGPYDVAAIESEDPMALYEWLLDNDYNVNDVMLPYIEAYTNEGMKFLALKLQKDAEVTDIQPFAFDLPGSSPGIPLRMTALAAEPEMGVLVFVLGAERYAGANWSNLEVADDQIVFKQNTWPMQTNWTTLVAKAVDEAGGQGWVTELAGSTEPILTALDNSFFATPEDEEAGAALRELIGDASYVSRLYSRLSAEEMTTDPIFRRDEGGDVSNVHMLSRIVNGEDQCPDVPVSPDPCLFTSCGAGGICRPVMMDGAIEPVAGCGCLDDATARTTFDPAGLSLQADGSAVPAPIVVCQNARMSFVNPGDTMPDGAQMPDPCESFDCGANGECLAINMTPTCVCDHGMVAVGSYGADGTRQTKCVEPMAEVPASFYMQRLPDLPADLPGGREMVASSDLPVIEPSMDDLGSSGLPVPDDDDDNNSGDDDPAAGSGGASAGSDGASAGSDGASAGSDGASAGDDDDDDCAVATPGTRSRNAYGPLALLLLAATLIARRRTARKR